VLVCAGAHEQFVSAQAIGIGMLDAAISLSRFCRERKPKGIHFIGTAGSYGKFKIMDVIESSKACNIENSFFNAGSYSPVAHHVSHETIPNEIVVNSSNYITTDMCLGSLYQKQNIFLENMEFYAVMKVAERFGIPARGTFVVTNYCNAEAHEDFLQNHSAAMQKLTQYIKEAQ